VDQHDAGDPDDSDAAAPTTGESLRLRKYTVTEEQNVTVPVTREEVRLEPDPDGAGTEGSAGEAANRNQRGKHRA
jgi:hypothetical protein